MISRIAFLTVLSSAALAKEYREPRLGVSAQFPGSYVVRDAPELRTVEWRARECDCRLAITITLELPDTVEHLQRDAGEVKLQHVGDLVVAARSFGPPDSAFGRGGASARRFVESLSVTPPVNRHVDRRAGFALELPPGWRLSRRNQGGFAVLHFFGTPRAMLTRYDDDLEDARGGDALERLQRKAFADSDEIFERHRRTIAGGTIFDFRGRIHTNNRWYFVAIRWLLVRDHLYQLLYSDDAPNPVVDSVIDGFGPAR